MGLPPILKPGLADSTSSTTITGTSDETTSTSLSGPYPPNNQFLERWKSLAPPNTDIRVSHDAGHYLCDFIYYTSLSLAYQQNRDRSVLFLHVPGASEDADIERGRAIAVALIKTVVTCWIDEKHHSG